MFRCVIAQVDWNHVQNQSNDKRIKPSVTSQEQGYVIDESKIWIRKKGVPSEWQYFKFCVIKN